MKSISSLLCLALASCLLGCLLPSIGEAAGPALDQSPSAYAAPIANDSARAMLVSFLGEARSYTLNRGEDEAIAAFSDPKGEFVRGEMYVFAYDFNGILLAHPYLHSLIGRNNLDLVDPNGIHTISNLLKVADRGSGFAYNVYPNPNRANQTELKLLYVLKVDDGMWLGSGIYLSDQAPLFSFKDQRRLKAFVDAARDYALENGKAKAVAAFNDPKGEFVAGDLHISAYNFSGEALSLPFQPELLGRNQLEATDANGVAFVRDLSDLAGTGGGETYYIYPNPSDGMKEELRLSSSSKVNDSWWLGAGIYSGMTSVLNVSAMKPINRDELKTFVEEAYSHVLVTGKDKALKEFMDLNSSWVRGDVYVFAQDFNGTELCLPYMPDEVGTNRLNVTNDQGVYINREMRAVAMNGSGFCEYIWRNPLSNQSEPKLSYVTKVDDSWWLGSGIYLA
jgi:signal transduction histidine kinase